MKQHQSRLRSHQLKQPRFTPNARKLRAEPPECDPTAFSAHLSGLSANLKVENAPIELDFFYGDYIDGEAGCLEKCQQNPECFAFDITCDAEYALYLCTRPAEALLPAMAAATVCGCMFLDPCSSTTVNNKPNLARAPSSHVHVAPSGGCMRVPRWSGRQYPTGSDQPCAACASCVAFLLRARCKLTLTAPMRETSFAVRLSCCDCFPPTHCHHCLTSMPTLTPPVRM